MDNDDDDDWDYVEEDQYFADEVGYSTAVKLSKNDNEWTPMMTMWIDVMCLLR